MNTSGSAHAGRGYRSDIDGLRAVAIIPVLLFHLGSPWFRGGFVGVDVFFVISGFLITGILEGDIGKNRMSVVQFYHRRIRRIFPALFLVVALSTLAALWLFTPPDLRDFGQSVAANSAFASNFLFWFEHSGYFDSGPLSKPMLHTWSLAVEEQFYFVFPFSLILLTKFAPSRKASLILLAALASFFAAAWGVDNAPSAAFYLPHSRAWELFLGSLLALNVLPAPDKKVQRDALSLTGAALIAWSVFTYTEHTKFPGAAALIPCVGTALIIWAGLREPSLVGRWLSYRPIVAVGLISYSLYLWHWPMIVFFKYYLVRDLTGFEAFVVILGSFLGAWFSYQFVEKPIRGKKVLAKQQPLFAAAAAVILIFFCLGYAMHVTSGFPGRLPPGADLLAEGKNDINPDRERCLNIPPDRIVAGDLCVLGDRSANQPSILVWGDSHADALMPGFKQAAEKLGVPGWLGSQNGCPPLIGIFYVNDASRWCLNFNDGMFNFIKTHKITTVVLVARWSFYTMGYGRGDPEFDIKTGPVLLGDSVNPTPRDLDQSRIVLSRALKRTIHELTAAGINVFLVREPPQVPHYSPPMALSRFVVMGKGADQITPFLATHRARQAVMDAILADVSKESDFSVIDLSERICSGERCAVAHDGRSLYADDDHLSGFGARYVSELMAPVFAKPSPP